MNERLIVCTVSPSHLVLCPDSEVMHPYFEDLRCKVVVKIDTGADQSTIPTEVVDSIRQQGHGLSPAGTISSRVASGEVVEDKPAWYANIKIKGANGDTWIIRHTVSGKRPKLAQLDKPENDSCRTTSNDEPVVLLGMDLLRHATRFEYHSDASYAFIGLGERAEHWTNDRRFPSVATSNQ